MSTTQLAHEAFDRFHAAEHDKCASVLDQLLAAKNNSDTKVRLNKFINEYYKQGCPDPQTLLTKLSSLYEKAKDKAQKEKEKPKKKTDDEEEDVESFREDDDLSVLRFNQALLHLELRQIVQATCILEELFQGIEPIDDYLAIKICFLLLELRILQRQPEQAFLVLAYLDKPSAFVTMQLTEKNGKGEDGKEEGAAAAEETAGDPASKATGPRQSLSFGNFLVRHGRGAENLSPSEYRFLCSVYRARVSMMLKNFKGAKKDAKSSYDICQKEMKTVTLLSGLVDEDDRLQAAMHSHQTAMVNMFKAFTESQRTNVRKAMKLMALCHFNFAESQGEGGDKGSRNARTNDNEDAEDASSMLTFHPAEDPKASSVFFNNMGCVYLFIQKPQAATVYFQKALDGMKSSTDPLPPEALRIPCAPVTKMWLDRRAEVAYNAGLQMVLSERWRDGLRCFEVAATVFREWPRLWLRMAECLIEIYRKQEAKTLKRATHSRGAPNWQTTRPDRPGKLRHLTWGTRMGEQRRWLFTTDHCQPLGPPASAAIAAGGGAGASSSADSGDAQEKAAAAEKMHLLLQARMYLRTVLMLVSPVLTEKDTAAGSDAGGEPAPSTGSRAGKATPSAAAASPTTNSNAARNASPFPHGFRGQARSLAEAEAHLLEDAACVKLAFVCLCQSDYHAALLYSKKVLIKNGLPDGGGEKSGETKAIFTPPDPSNIHERAWTSSPATLILAALYATEALLMLGCSSEARNILGNFLDLDVPAKGSELYQSSGISSHIVGYGAPCRPDGTGQLSEEQEAAAREVLGRAPTATMGGLTPPSYVIQNLGTVANLMMAGNTDSGADDKKDKNARQEDKSASLQVALLAYPPTHFPKLASSSAALYTNLAVLQAQENKLDQAQETCQKALKLEPRGLAPVRTMAYILLRKGDREGALRIVKQCRS